MIFHDSYARRTPFELAFAGPDSDDVDDIVASIAEEAEALGVDTGNPAAFLMLGSVGGLLRKLQDADARTEAFYDYGLLAYHGYHFQRAGRPLYLVDTAATRYLVEGVPGGVAPQVPAQAGYVQWPRHLFWTAAEGETPPEPIDGFSWVLPQDGRLRLLLVGGMRAGRPGVTVLPIDDAPWEDAESWMTIDVREHGTDFATTLPGGELDGLYSLLSAGEALKLCARLFAYVTSVPGAVTSRDGGGSRSEAGSEEPDPSSFAYQHVTLDA